MTQDKRSALMGPRTAPAPLPHLSRFGNPLSGILFLLMEWQGRANQRMALEELDARSLEDIGVTAEDRAEEVRKPFWRR